MDRRTIVRFVSGSPELGATSCVHIYWGGDPNEMQFVFTDFFRRIEEEAALDTRYREPETLAARFLVFMSMYSYEASDNEEFKLDFSGVSIVQDKQVEADEFAVYSVVCDGDRTSRLISTMRRPKVLYHEVMLADGEQQGEKQVVWRRFLPIEEAIEYHKKEIQDE